MIPRQLTSSIKSKLNQGKAILIFGARQVGKTTLLHSLFDSQPHTLWLNGDDETTQATLAHPSVASFRPLLQDYRTIIIDEAQRIPDIGLKLKILQDNFGDTIQLIATGSSSFELANKVNEPLTGRKWTFQLPTLTASELVTAYGPINEQTHLPNRLLYGSYPAVVTSPENSRDTVTELASDNLYKDIISLGEIIKTDKLRTILQALAFQIGCQVSMNELASLVGLDRKTVDKYIALLEQSFIIFRLPSFRRNLRNELKSSQKIYFYDNGIRNAIINDFRPIDLRPDLGQLFENYIISEFKKSHPHDNLYFWRNISQQEIDLILERDGQTHAFEVKYNPKKSAKFPTSFLDAYRPSSASIVHQNNYLQLIATNPTPTKGAQ